MGKELSGREEKAKGQSLVQRVSKRMKGRWGTLSSTRRGSHHKGFGASLTSYVPAFFVEASSCPAAAPLVLGGVLAV